ncbi:MAG TPA: helix-turn-helix domain-containing protein [Bacteroidales bacterium]|nr:helix-turn-helix domain-containing protein [Bacteroidales bacterium]
MNHAEDIGTRIAKARKKKSLSQAQLAGQIFISAQAVGKWERGESMPDIITLIRIAEILGVDLNYFSEKFRDKESESIVTENSEGNIAEKATRKNEKPRWDLSKLNLHDSDFSGLKNLHEKLCSANMQHCLFVDSDLSGLTLKNNRVSLCDFTNSNISNSQIQNSMLQKNSFVNCSLKNASFSGSYVEDCDFSKAALDGSVFSSGGFANNTLVNSILLGTGFVNMAIQHVVFDGIIEDCRFENCTFYNVKFQNAILLNSFFKNNKKLKQVKFINCRADKLSYAFLKNNMCDLSGITMISEPYVK